MEKRQVIQHFGNESQVAGALGITRQAVNQWPDPIPEGAAYKIQVITAGVLRVNPAAYERKHEASQTA